MDPFLIDYIKSGKAWVLVGSGPSNEMAYPNWRHLGEQAISLIRAEARDYSPNKAEAALQKYDYPRVFEEAQAALGLPRLLQHLHPMMRPGRTSRIYPLLARWPAQVYLTTNYDNEINAHLVRIQETYNEYSNSEEHIAHLFPDLRGAIVKLHGDLRSSKGLVLTSSQYGDISASPAWRYWRTKLTSVFQMNRVVVVGHSLTDPNIQHVLAAAKEGAGVLNPICWIAPDVTSEMARKYLEDYRIRVISYDNHDGSHKNLVRLLEDVTAFIPPRTTIRIREEVRQAAMSPLGKNAAASGFFVFNKLSQQEDFDESRVNVILVAVESAIPALAKIDGFTLEQALQLAGWPRDNPLPVAITEKVVKAALERELLIAHKNGFVLGPSAEALAKDNKGRFDHSRARFIAALKLRIRRHFADLTEAQAEQIANDIDASLTGYFRQGGLSLATTLFTSNARPAGTELPSSIIRFISESSARYSDLLSRQAFCSASIAAFVEAGDPEREYLGRLSQGFFAFHALGVFGDAAKERLAVAKETVWLLDSNALINAVALGTSTHSAFVDCFQRLSRSGIRLFTSEGLFEELWEHLWFADKVVSEHGPDSPNVFVAARGESPYRTSNQFLDGFVKWRAAGGRADWAAYLFEALGGHTPDRNFIKDTLTKLGVEVVAFQDWPGFTEEQFGLRDQEKHRIIELKDHSITGPMQQEFDLLSIELPEKKAKPEAEALLIVRHEREGVFHMLAVKGVKSSAWFISNTSLLNIDQPARITWRPDAFLSFSCTLPGPQDDVAVNFAFERILWSIAQCGVPLLREEVIQKVFGQVIEQAQISVEEQRALYKDTLEAKYGSMDGLMSAVAPSKRPLLALQIAKEIAQAEVNRRKALEDAAYATEKRAEEAEKKLKEVDGFRKKLERKKNRPKRK